jgi:hypothetical protein
MLWLGSGCWLRELGRLKVTCEGNNFSQTSVSYDLPYGLLGQLLLAVNPVIEEAVCTWKSCCPLRPPTFLDQFRNGDWKVQLMRRLKPTVDILLWLSTIDSGVFGQGIGLVRLLRSHSGVAHDTTQVQMGHLSTGYTSALLSSKHSACPK